MTGSHISLTLTSPLGFAALALLVAPAVGEDKVQPQTEVPSCEKFQERMLEIAREYTTYGRVDDEYRWAPWLCRMPNPALARFSASKDADTHGQKLYSILAKDRGAYYRELTKRNPVGQVIVKESWVPEETKDGQALLAEHRVQGGRQESFLRCSVKDGKLYRAKEKAGLFIMYKLDPQTPDTDKGWVYGTVAADMKTVTAAGKIESCIGCHQEAPHDRLFGLPKGNTYQDLQTELLKRTTKPAAK